MTNGAFAVLEGEAKFELVGAGDRSTNTFVKGRTYTVGKEAYYLNIQSDLMLLFSHQLFGKIVKDTKFSINNFNQEVLNLTDEPKRLRSGQHIFNATMQLGEAYFSFISTNEASSCIISTSIVDVELNSGKFYFIVENNDVTIYVLEGSATAHGSKNKKTVATADQFIMAKTIERKKADGSIESSLLMYSIEKSKVEDFKPSANPIAIEISAKPFIFVIVNGRITLIDTTLR
jgi:uncharacterized RmlC-like cupin family protein